MNVAFIHYHLETGGVTTVLRHQIESIRGACETLVLSGMLPGAPFPADVVCIPGLAYRDRTDPPLNPEDIAESIVNAIHSKWTNGCDLVHVHNPFLSKNIYFLKILKALQQRGLNLFLQIHDFAEDGRPDVYFTEPYPVDCHYGVINSRDYRLLRESGLKKEGVHKIHNRTQGVTDTRTHGIDSDLILYPIRARRRKNIGEAVLLSLFLKENETIAVTLPPTGSSDLKSYEGWKRFSGQNGLPIVFDIGLTGDFNTLMSAAKYVISTSISEGFGFSFLEPWIAGKLLWGRRLPDICYDFIQNGVQLDHLYVRLQIPMDWFNTAALFHTWKACVESTCLRFDYPIEPDTVWDHFTIATQDDTIDFGLLNETFQKKIISRLMSNPQAKTDLIDLNPFLLAPGYAPDLESLIRGNNDAVQRTYNRERYRQTLLDIYSKVKTVHVSHHIDKKLLLWSFFDLSRFSLLRWCDDVA